MYIYPWYISDLTATNDIGILTGEKVSKVFMLFENGYINMYYDEVSMEKVAISFLEHLKKDESFFQKVINNIYQLGDELLDYCKKVDAVSDMKVISDKKLLKLYSDYIKRLTALRAWGWVPTILEMSEDVSLTADIMEEFGKYLGNVDQAEKLSEYYSILSSSEKKSEVQTEELARLNLLLKVLGEKNADSILAIIKSGDQNALKKESPKVYKLFLNHLKDFGWLTYAYAGHVMSIEYLFKALNENVNAGDVVGQKEKLVGHYKNLAKEKEALIKKLSLPKNLIYLFRLSAELMFIKDYRKGIYQKSYVAMDRVMIEIANRMGLNMKEIKFLVLEEVKDAFKNKSFKKYHKILDERLKKCCYIAQSGKIKVYQGSECDKAMAGLELKKEKEEENITELKGMIAYKGKITGTVKIVLLESDVDKVNKGDILVSSATNPDLIIAMKKSGAIVTDFGGIMSHAAIVSRELKKPCVVGTKNGTRILKDGMRVEVDANKGIITILK